MYHIIKVASIPKSMQVYFIDNEEYFKGRHIEKDENGRFYEDNDERAIFFAKGVIETVKSLIGLRHNSYSRMDLDVDASLL